MPLTQATLAANNLGNTVAMAADRNRVFLYIRNYQTSSQNIYVRFGAVATPGNAGEIELIPGGDLVFGSNYQSTQIMPYYSNNCPLESINVITVTGSANGCVLAISSPYFTP